MKKTALAAAVAVALVAFAPAREARPAPPPDDTGILAVVAPRRFHAALGPFVAHKQRTLSVRLVVLEDAVSDAAAGQDDAERLKTFLYRQWESSSKALRWVLLVGDADVLPVRYMCLDRVTAPAFDYAFYPSDLYYADLAKRDGSFDDWNEKKDGFHGRYFGEVRGEKNKSDPINYDAIDYRPDVALGRWPVSTEAEVATVVAKTIAFEERLDRGEAPRRAAFVVTGGWVDARAQLDGLAARLHGWTTERRYYKDAARPDATPPDEAGLVKLLNQGASLVVHAGHGSDDSWEGCFATSSIAKLENAARLPVLLSAGCSTARFATLPPYEGYRDADGKDHVGTNAGQVFAAPPPPPDVYQRGAFNPTGLGEQLLRRGPSGAVAYIGCNTGSQPCGLTLAEGFVRALERAPAPRLGECWSRALAHYWVAERLATIAPTPDWYPASIFFQGMKFMLFGDPSLRLPRAAKRFY